MKIEELLNNRSVTISVTLDELKEFAEYILSKASMEADEQKRLKDEEVYYSVDEAMEVLNIKNRSTLWRWNKSGYMKANKVGKLIRYKKTDINNMLNGERTNNIDKNIHTIKISTISEDKKNTLMEVSKTIQIINSEFKEALIELGIKKMSLAVLKDCLISTANQVEKNYYKAVENDLSSITTPSIRNSLLLDAKIEFGAFRTKLKKIKPKVKNVEYLTIEDNLCVLTPENEAKLIEYFKRKS